MDMVFKEKVLSLHRKFFDGSELPIVFYYTERCPEEYRAQPVRCLIEGMSEVRKGKSLCFYEGAIACAGGKRFLGFSEQFGPGIEQFLSRVEHIKKTPELAGDMVKNVSGFKAPAGFIIFKRWDMLEESDRPEVVIYFARVDLLSALYTLANYDEHDGAIAPSGSGCSSIVLNPYLERGSEHPRAIIGMLDVSARPFVPEDVLTFAVPMERFVTMVDNMEGSFLGTKTWQAVQARINSSAKNMP